MTFHGKASVWSPALIGSALVVLTPALWNGFPFMFYDTTSFIEQAVHGGFRAERSVFYAWFLALFWPTISLWPAMAAQTLMTVLVMAEVAHRVAPSLSPRDFFAMIVALTVGTSLPWYAGQVLPDILAPLMVLSLYVLGFHAHALDGSRRAGLIGVAVFAATSHASHLGLAAGLAAVIAILQIATLRWEAASARPCWRWPALVCALALGLGVASNFARTGEVFINRSGPAFLLARLMQDGIVQRLLDDTCPQSGYRLCVYKDTLPKTADEWLWSTASPFNGMGGFEGTAEESRHVIAASLQAYPLLHMKMAALNTGTQLVSFATGDGIDPQNEQLAPIFRNLAPRQLASFEAARQQSARIDFAWINLLHVTVGALSIAALVAILMVSVRRRQRDDSAFLPIFLLLALLGNAFICGALSNPHDRYQSRLMWATSFTTLLLVARRPRTVSIKAELNVVTVGAVPARSTALMCTNTS